MWKLRSIFFVMLKNKVEILWIFRPTYALVHLGSSIVMVISSRPSSRKSRRFARTPELFSANTEDSIISHIRSIFSSGEALASFFGVAMATISSIIASLSATFNDRARMREIAVLCDGSSSSRKSARACRSVSPASSINSRI